jgi:hypothetical protein
LIQMIRSKRLDQEDCTKKIGSRRLDQEDRIQKIGSKTIVS